MAYDSEKELNWIGLFLNVYEVYLILKIWNYSLFKLWKFRERYEFLLFCRKGWSKLGDIADFLKNFRKSQIYFGSFLYFKAIWLILQIHY